MTLMTAMTMNCRTFLNGMRHSAVRSRNGVMGREQLERKCDKARRCSRLVRPLGDRKKRNASSCSVSLTTRTVSSSSLCRSVSSRRSLGDERGQGLCYVSTFYTILVKKFEEGNGGIRSAENTPATHSGE